MALQVCRLLPLLLRKDLLADGRAGSPHLSIIKQGHHLAQGWATIAMACRLPESLRTAQVFKVARFGDPVLRHFLKKTALKSLKGIPIFAAEP